MTVMRLVKVNRDETNPARAERRALGTLLMPTDPPERLNRDATIIVSK